MYNNSTEHDIYKFNSVLYDVFELPGCADVMKSTTLVLTGRNRIVSINKNSNFSLVNN